LRRARFTFALVSAKVARREQLAAQNQGHESPPPAGFEGARALIERKIA
jgi:hypothetical protein